MATSPVPQWAQEMSPSHRGPTGARVLWVAILAILLVLALQAFPTTSSGGQEGSRVEPAGAPVSTVPACAQHWPPTCKPTKYHAP